MKKLMIIVAFTMLLTGCGDMFVQNLGSNKYRLKLTDYQ